MVHDFGLTGGISIFVSRLPYVIAHDLRRGIPFEDDSFDVVYHSHVLEHFDRRGGATLLMECARVLKSGGILRVAVPDLERSVVGYLDVLRESNQDGSLNLCRYDWMLIELTDQLCRNQSGGEMGPFVKAASRRLS